jgi:hypothetical protein
VNFALTADPYVSVTSPPQKHTINFSRGGRRRERATSYGNHEGTRYEYPKQRPGQEAKVVKK